jgi:hypothetical protein
LILLLIVLAVFLIFLDFSYLKLNTADSSIYLSTAENIAHHKGLVVSYNLCQSFKGLYHPLLPYYQPLYSMFVSFFIDHGGILLVIQMNILLFALNAALIFYLLQSFIPTRLNILFVFLLVFSYNFYFSSMYPWTEQFYFFGFIINFILFLKYKESRHILFWLGAFNGLLMLVRVAHLYNFAAFLPILFIGNDPWRRKCARALCFVSGFVVAYGFYQLFCLKTFHALYPEYARPGASYGMARITSGIIYNADKVGIQLSPGALFSMKSLGIIVRHLKDFYGQMPGFLWMVLIYFFLPADKKQDRGLVLLCLIQSLCTVLGYSLTFYWLPVYFEALRYSLVPYVLISVAGWYCLYQASSLLRSSRKISIAGLVVVLLLGLQVHKFVGFRSDFFKNSMWQRPYYKDLLEADAWIDKNLPQEILVASNDDQQAYFMHRPFIAIPPGKSFNCANLSLFNRIYKPDFYLLSSEKGDQCFTAVPHKQVFTNKTFRLYQTLK